MEGICDFSHPTADLGNRVVDLGIIAKALVGSMYANIPRLALAGPLQRHRCHIVQTRILRIPLLPDLQSLFGG